MFWKGMNLKPSILNSSPDEIRINCLLVHSFPTYLQSLLGKTQSFLVSNTW